MYVCYRDVLFLASTCTYTVRWLVAQWYWPYGSESSSVVVCCGWCYSWMWENVAGRTGLSLGTGLYPDQSFSSRALSTISLPHPPNHHPHSGSTDVVRGYVIPNPVRHGGYSCYTSCLYQTLIILSLKSSGSCRFVVAASFCLACWLTSDARPVYPELVK